MDSDIMAANGATTLTFPPTDCLPKRTVVVGSANNAASSYLMAVRNIGVIVKCSGSKHVMKPAVYGTNNGRAVEVFQFPVNYKGLQDKLQPLLLTMKRVWLEDQAVLFHCNGGIHRAPAGYGIAMANINCTSIKDDPYRARFQEKRVLKSWTPPAALLLCDQYMAICKGELIQVHMNALEEGWAWARSDDAVRAGWIPPAYVEGGCLELVCAQCGGYGHMSVDCRQDQKSTGL